MKLSNQVVSLSLAQKLKQLGVKQESYFWWVRDMFEDKYNLENWRGQYAEDMVNKDTYVSAYSVAELGEMLPGNDGKCYYQTQKGLMGNRWFCIRKRMSDDEQLVEFEEKNEADARASMLIYLLENSLINLEDINK